MYIMNVTFNFGRISLIRDFTGATREECMAQVDLTLEGNPALDYVINSEGQL